MEKKGFRGILEHATGSGKTFTALTASKEHLKDDGLYLAGVINTDKRNSYKLPDSRATGGRYTGDFGD